MGKILPIHFTTHITLPEKSTPDSGIQRTLQQIFLRENVLMTMHRPGLANLNVLSLVNSLAGSLFAGTENGIYSSTDCDTWTALNSGLP